MEARKLFSGVGFGYVLFFLAYMAFTLLCIAAIKVICVFNPNFEVSAGVLAFLSQVAMYGFALPLMWLWLRQIPAWDKPQRSRIPWGALALVLVFCFGITYLGNLIGSLLMFAASFISGEPIVNPVEEMLQENGLVSVFFYTVIMAPLMEELVFRKLLIDRIIPYGQKAAVVVSGLAFGLFHGNFFQFFYAAMMGMVFAYLYSQTGTIWYSVALHGIINFVGGFLSSAMYLNMDENSLIFMLYAGIMGFFMMGTSIAALVLFFVFRRKVHWFPAWVGLPERGLWRTILLAPGVLAYLACCALMFLMG